MNKASNKRDFDYLFLRKRDSGEAFYKVEKELVKFDDHKCANIFSERVQKFNTSLHVTECCILVTNESVYLFDNKINFMSRHSVRDCVQIILIKTNPCVFVLCFRSGPPLLLQSFRRTELVLFLLT